MSIIMNNLINKIDKLESKKQKLIKDIKFLQKEIYKNKNQYGVMKTDSKNLIKCIENLWIVKINLMELYKKQNDLIKNQ